MIAVAILTAFIIRYAGSAGVGLRIANRCIGGLAQDIYTRLRALAAKVLKTSITILAVRLAHAPLAEVGLVVAIGCTDGAPIIIRALTTGPIG